MLFATVVFCDLRLISIWSKMDMV